MKELGFVPQTAGSLRHNFATRFINSYFPEPVLFGIRTYMGRNYENFDFLLKN
jgi:hypothetical protein